MWRRLHCACRGTPVAAQNTDKAVAGPTPLGEGGWRLRTENRQLYFSRQLSGNTRCPRADLFNAFQRVIVGTGRDGTRHRIQLEKVLGHNPKEARPRPADRPEQVGVLLLIGDDETAISQHDIGGLDTEAGRPPCVPVPAQPAIQQIAAHGNRLAVPDGKGQPVRGQLPVECLSGDRRLNRRRAGPAINREVIKAPKINQQTPVAQRKPYPTMPPATHGDFHVLRAGKPDGLDDIMLIRDLHDHLRVAHRRQLIPNEFAPELFVPGVGRGRHLPFNAALQSFQFHLVFFAEFKQPLNRGGLSEEDCHE